LRSWVGGVGSWKLEDQDRLEIGDCENGGKATCDLVYLGGKTFAIGG
jgi:hypothetical protein